MTTANGTCLCGTVRWEYDGEIGPAGICHCSDCRHVTGSAFGVSVQLEIENFHILAGDVKGFEMHAESGSPLTRHFCAVCGSPIHTLSPAHPDHVYVEAGSFNDPTLVHLSHQSWTRSAVDWAIIPPDLPAFEKGRT